MIDLHMHSSCSDGQHSPEKLVEIAETYGITHLALTDHDTISGLSAARTAAQKHGIRFLCGIEISTNVRHQHILGLGVSPASDVLRDACEQFEQRRIKRLHGILDALNGLGIALDPEQVTRYASGQVGRPHIARAMMDKGYVSSVSEAFEKYLSLPSVRAVKDSKISDADAIALIHAAGGHAILAHPLELSDSMDAIAERMDCLRGMGLDGVEAFYRTHTPEQCAFFSAYAERYGLIVTGGSDYHGELIKPDVLPGIPPYPQILSQTALCWE